MQAPSPHSHKKFFPLSPEGAASQSKECDCGWSKEAPSCLSKQSYTGLYQLRICQIPNYIKIFIWNSSTFKFHIYQILQNAHSNNNKPVRPAYGTLLFSRNLPESECSSGFTYYFKRWVWSSSGETLWVSLAQPLHWGKKVRIHRAS